MIGGSSRYDQEMWIGIRMPRCIPCPQYDHWSGNSCDDLSGGQCACKEIEEKVAMIFGFLDMSSTWSDCDHSPLSTILTNSGVDSKQRPLIFWIFREYDIYDRNVVQMANSKKKTAPFDLLDIWSMRDGIRTLPSPPTMSFILHSLCTILCSITQSFSSSLQR